MIIDIYSMQITAAQRNIAVLTRILDGTWEKADLFDLHVLLRVRLHMQPAEQLPFMERVWTRAMHDEDRTRLETLMSDEHCNLHNAHEQHQQDVSSGVKY